MSNLANISNPPQALSEKLFWFFAGLTLLSVFAAAAIDLPYLVAVPFVVLFFYVTVVDFRWIYYLMLLSVPLSIEVEFGSLATDLPAEPLMVGLMLLFFIQVISKKNDNFEFYRHPLIWLLGLYYFWFFFTTAFSQNFLVSFKQLLVKTWYITVFVFLTGQMNRTETAIRRTFWLLLVPNLIGTGWALYQFKDYGFSFEYVNEAMSPFYRNHVNYAAILTLYFPFAVAALSWYERLSVRWWVVLSSIFLLAISIQLSFTRAAYAALAVAFVAYFIIRFRLIKYVLVAAVLAALAGVGYVTNNNKYLDYAPDYHKAISHYEFDDLMTATYEMEDASTMERLYRWVAGYQMVGEHPITGFGPGNFYGFYKGYSVALFRTYVSNNIDKSGIHNYYLMTLIEQGFVGLFIFLALIFGFLIKGEQIYHQIAPTDKFWRTLVMAILLSMIIICTFILINDLLEAIQIGAFFFINIALLIVADLKRQSEVENEISK